MIIYPVLEGQLHSVVGITRYPSGHIGFYSEHDDEEEDEARSSAKLMDE